MIASKPDSPNEGERRKADAHALLKARRKVFINRGRRALLKALLTKGNTTTDDVRLTVKLPQAIDPRCFGAVPGALARAGIIRLERYTKSSRPNQHASVIAVWRLDDREMAIAWLRDHPDGHGPPSAEVGGESNLFDNVT